MKEKTTELLLIFTRNPEKGKVKKRLAQNIGDEAALKVYNYLLQHTVAITRPLPVEKWVYYSEALPENDIWEKDLFRKKLQQGQNLGQRMEQAFSEAFKAGFKKVVIIGSDLFDIEKEDLKMAFLTLEDHEYVVGPAQDGGYFLLGMKKPTPQLFRNKDWSTSRVLDQTLNDLEQEKLKLLPVRNDIDTFEDMRSHPELMKLID
ncbi:TIGR04282 family arsenosugar biosynthesis glycosyltransferase [Salinimicrobium sp. WS361]|uniref:TIGR04282 family arsenosugar biosynthesis glycosyltransferase n=1 Tax=Salinimicrobium sp. WS361 TaxID=3425123 RepID=UPI003D6F7979